MKAKYVAPTVAFYTVELEQAIVQGSQTPKINYNSVQYTDYEDGGDISEDVLIF